MRQFKLFNKDRTVSIDLNSGGILVIDNSTGLGNRRDNTILNARVRNYLINTANNFQPITLKIVFGVGGKNAYALYNDLMNFIRQHGPEGLVLGYKALKEMIYTDVALVEATKSNKTNFGVLEETFTFDRLTPFYRYKKEEGKSILIKNDYYENILPKITLTGEVRAAPEIKIEGINKINLDDMVEDIAGISIRYEKATNTFIFNGTGNGGWYPITIPELTDKFVSITRVNLTENKHNASIRFLCYDFDNSKSVGELEGSEVGEQSKVMYQHQGDLRYGFYFNGTFEDYRVKVQIAEALPTRNEVPLLLAGKEYLGDGTYVLVRQSGGTLTYNVNTGECRLFGNLTGTLTYVFGPRPAGDYYIQIWKTKEVVFNSGEILFGHHGSGTRHVKISPTRDYDGKVPEYVDNTRVLTYQVTGEIDVSFKVQLEKGDTATPFINPYIPVAYSEPADFKQTITILSPLQATDEFVIDAEFKEVKRNGNQAYNEIDKTKNTFPVIPKGSYKIASDQPIMVEWKEWVID